MGESPYIEFTAVNISSRLRYIDKSRRYSPAGDRYIAAQFDMFVACATNSIYAAHKTSLVFVERKRLYFFLLAACFFGVPSEGADAAFGGADGYKQSKQTKGQQSPHAPVKLLLKPYTQQQKGAYGKKHRQTELCNPQNQRKKLEIVFHPITRKKFQNQSLFYHTSNNYSTLYHGKESAKKIKSDILNGFLMALCYMLSFSVIILCIFTSYSSTGMTPAVHNCSSKHRPTVLPP